MVLESAAEAGRAERDANFVSVVRKGAEGDARERGLEL